MTIDFAGVRRSSQLFFLIGLSALVIACSGTSSTKKTPLSGERISVLAFEQELRPDPRISDVKVVLPPPYVNRNWSQGGGNSSNVHHHLAVGRDLEVAWRRSIGANASRTKRYVSAPVIAQGTLYAIDSNATVSAFDAIDGREVWKLRLSAEREKKASAFGGGIAVGSNFVFATTGYGFVVGININSGEEVWRQYLNIPLRGSPGYADGRLFVVTQDNQLFALDADTGNIIWDHVGIVENAGILGTATPAVSGSTIITAYSSGELYALLAENGRVAWSDTLSRTGRLTSLSTLSDIDGNPVVDRGQVFAISHAGRMAAIDLTSGARLWENNVGSVSTPWVAGDYIYVLTTENALVCLTRRDGRVRWVRPLQRFAKVSKKKGPITWQGPVLVSDRLLVASSHGYLLSISPYTGEVLGGEKFSTGTFVPPVVADQTVYLLSQNGDVIAYR